MDDRIIVGSMFLSEPSEWGWKYGFTLNTEISREQLSEALDVLEDFLNKKRIEEKK